MNYADKSAQASVEVKSRETESTRGVTRTTKLLAGSFYTRGLWSPLQAWLSLSRCPYRMPPINWGIDQVPLRSELRRAFLAAWIWTAAEICAFVNFRFSDSNWWGAVLVFLVLIQWLVYPYFAVRSVFRRLEKIKVRQYDPALKLVTLGERDGSIDDMGYLLREATFSIDCTKKMDSWTEPAEDTPAPLTAELFYSEIKKAFADATTGLRTMQLFTCAAKDIQPRFGDWKKWLRPDEAPYKAGIDGSSRLLVLGQHQNVDGLAVTEVIAKMVGPHIAFRLRMRLLPAFKRRLQKLELLICQKAWWRGVLVPIGLGLLLFSVWWLGSYLLISEPSIFDPASVALSSNGEPDTPGFDEAETSPDPGMNLTLGQVLQAKSYSLDSYPYYGSQLPLLFFSKGALTSLALLASVMAFLPPVLLLLALTLRTLRFLRGLICSASGTYLFVGSKSCLRFKLAGAGMESEDSVQSSISYLQIMEQVITNRIIEVLQRNGVDTSAIRDEMKLFVNQGIYMSGGEFHASNVMVGAKGVMGMLRRRAARTGKRALMARPVH